MKQQMDITEHAEETLQNLFDEKQEYQERIKEMEERLSEEEGVSYL